MATEVEKLRRQLDVAIRAQAVKATSLAWRRIQERHDHTTEELQADTSTDAWIMTAAQDFAEAEKVARQAYRDLTTIAVRELNISSLALAQMLGVSHTTVLRWLPPED